MSKHGDCWVVVVIVVGSVVSVAKPTAANVPIMKPHNAEHRNAEEHREPTFVAPLRHSSSSRSSHMGSRLLLPRLRRPRPAAKLVANTFPLTCKNF